MICHLVPLLLWVVELAIGIAIRSSSSGSRRLGFGLFKMSWIRHELFVAVSDTSTISIVVVDIVVVSVGIRTRAIHIRIRVVVVAAPTGIRRSH